jgi:hypothetical protein
VQRALARKLACRCRTLRDCEKRLAEEQASSPRQGSSPSSPARGGSQGRG